jgi:hypothetical protein
MLPALLALALPALPARAEPLFDPADTVAVVAGVLEWEHKGFESFPKDKRKDAELYAVLGSLGVERRTLLLDEQATRPAILGAVREAVAMSGPKTTLLFYYAGHGAKDKDGSIAFASREMDPWKHETGLRLPELTRLFVDGGKRLFRGRRVVLLADCCHSGGLAGTAKALSDAGIEAVALTSADASNVSTGNWTFTRTLLEALRGGARCDADRDGAVTLAELAEETRLAMKHREDQRYGYANHGVPADAAVSKAEPGKETRGDPPWALAPREGREEPARVLALEKERARVAFYDYADETLAWVPRSSLKPHFPATYPVGARLSVDWDGQDYAAEVLKVEDGFHLITYPGWGPEWDEWVGEKRIQGALEPGEQASRPLKVEWRGSWWDASLKGRKGDLYCVRYLGYDASWDECVPRYRARF